jgi:hypothetical protein
VSSRLLPLTMAANWATFSSVCGTGVSENGQ